MAFFVFVSIALSAVASPSEDKTGQQQLKMLKDVNNSNTIFDNYSTGVISPFDKEKDINK